MQTLFASPFYNHSGQMVPNLVELATAAYGEQAEVVIQREQEIALKLGQLLPDSFTLLRTLGNQIQPRLLAPDLILVGDTGIWLFILEHAAGVYQILGDAWRKYNPTELNHFPCEPNLVALALAQNNYLMDLLQEQSLPAWTHPIILLTNDDAHIELRQNAVQGLTKQQLPNFIEHDLKSRLTVMEAPEVAKVVRALAGIDQPQLVAHAPATAKPNPKRRVNARRWAGMTLPQLALLAVFGVLNVLLICVFIGLVINTNYPELLAPLWHLLGRG
jgi:hypothetical protein